ncbi:aminoglycoside phosphotransferase family protein [Paenibacillus sp. GD4]|uniref:phosphotransferase family protein n=1 Tax=Paenibacillus sp. GD4 TaxID=3068890 RepID=UPI002796B2C3|nr:aminoglycoside phosphotransferase family protein [Paenibacillus sp. GD4]MDQ1910124.1 aminoglycoside phosphotransferase family protein [Paenibacillus sp. GD4]
MADFPSSASLQWAAACVGTDASVESVQPMPGGASSAVHRVVLRSRGSLHQLVLRQFTNREWLEKEPDLALHEARSLGLAETTGVTVPRVIGFHEEGVDDQRRPLVLMSLLPGHVDLQPVRMDVWLHRLAEPLVQIHRCTGEEHAWTYFSYNDCDSLTVPSWTELPALWEQAIRIVRQPPPEGRTVFLHRDYHPTNVLWQDGRVSGVVDWVNACRGPAGVDVGHCRLNLALLFGPETAGAFLSAYRRLAGDDFDYQPYWELVSILEFLPGPPEVYSGWTACGVTHLTPAMMRDRLECHLAAVLADL